VITSNVSSIPEVTGDAAILIDPLDAGSISRALKAMEADDALCDDLSRRGIVQAQQFSSFEYEKRLRKLYAELL